VRYSYGQDILTKESQYPNLPAGYGTGVNPVHPRGEAIGETHTFSPNIVNEFRYGHLYDFYGYVSPMDGIPISANLGILNANRNSLLGGGAAINGGWPEGTYTGDGGPYTFRNRAINLWMRSPGPRASYDQDWRQHRKAPGLLLSGQ